LHFKQTQMEAGFARVEADLDDIDLDCPHAAALFAQYKAHAQAEGWLAPAAA
jgi:hypothetical protein